VSFKRTWLLPENVDRDDSIIIMAKLKKKETTNSKRKNKGKVVDQDKIYKAVREDEDSNEDAKMHNANAS